MSEDEGWHPRYRRYAASEEDSSDSDSQSNRMSSGHKDSPTDSKVLPSTRASTPTIERDRRLAFYDKKRRPDVIEVTLKLDPATINFFFLTI